MNTGQFRIHEDMLRDYAQRRGVTLLFDAQPA
jgi:hypothetical protein